MLLWRVARSSEGGSGGNDDMGQSVEESIETIYPAAKKTEAGIVYWRCDHHLPSR